MGQTGLMGHCAFTLSFWVTRLQRYIAQRKGWTLDNVQLSKMKRVLQYIIPAISYVYVAKQSSTQTEADETPSKMNVDITSRVYSIK